MFKVQGSGLARGAARPLITFESLNRMRNEKWWCGAFRHPERRKTSYVRKWFI